MTRLERPTDDEIRAALARILASAAFSRSERLRAFLSYVVTKDLAGLSQQLKGYTIAVDVFRRPEAFNADSDPLVRVHAGKLRKLLAVYDETEGADAPWRIEIPKGGYAPVYVWRTSSPLVNTRDVADESAQAADVVAVAVADVSADPVPEVFAGGNPVNSVFSSPPHLEEPQPEKPEAGASRSEHVETRRYRKQRWTPAPFASPIAMISILPLLLFAPLSSSALGVNPQIQARLSLSLLALEADVGLPIVSVRNDGQVEGPSARLAEQVRHAMDYYTVIIPAADDSTPTSNAMLPVSARTTVPKSPLSFTISLKPAEDQDRTDVVVTSDATGDVVSTMVIENDHLVDEMDLLFESLGIAAKTLATNGDLFHYASDKGFSSPLMECMLVTDLYRREKSREALEGAKLCQAQLLSKGPVKNDRQFVISASELRKNVHP